MVTRRAALVSIAMNLGVLPYLVLALRVRKPCGSYRALAGGGIPPPPLSAGPRAVSIAPTTTTSTNAARAARTARRHPYSKYRTNPPTAAGKPTSIKKRTPGSPDE